MQSEKKEEVKKEVACPGLYQSQSSGNIYLLRDSSAGVCVFSYDEGALGRQVGEYCEGLIANWIPYEGSITLRN